MSSDTNANCSARGRKARATALGRSAAGAQKTGDPLLDKLHAALAAQLADGSNAQGKNPKPTKKKQRSKPDPFQTLRQLTDPHSVTQRHTTIRNGTGQATISNTTAGTAPTSARAE